MKKILMFFIICGIIVGFITGFKPNETETENNYTNNIESPIENNQKTELNLSISEIDTLNPLTTQNNHIANILKLIYEPLISYDNENQIEASLATEWVKKDEITWILKLRENVFWHGGEKFTSKDVQYTINLLINQEITSKYFANVKNIKAVDVVDDTTIVITLNIPDSHIISKLTFPIIPQYYFKNGDITNKEKANRPIGTGAYKYLDASEKQITLVANEEWWKEEIKLDKINLLKYATYSEAIKGFKSSEIDMIITSMHDWKEKFGFIGINSYNYESTEYEAIIPNVENKILNEASVRRAILQAINRDNIVSTVYDENAIVQDIPIQSSSKYSSAKYEYDMEKAKQILINAGWTQTNQGWKKGNDKLEFTLTIPKNDEDKKLVAEKIKQDLNEISINIKVKEQNFNEFEKNIKTGNFQLALVSLDIKNEYQLQEIVQTGNIFNFARYTNGEMDKVIEKLQNTEGIAYDEAMEEFKQIYKNEMPYIGLYYKTNTILTNKSVKGEYKSTSYNPYRNIINFYK